MRNTGSQNVVDVVQVVLEAEAPEGPGLAALCADRITARLLEDGLYWRVCSEFAMDGNR